MCPKGGWGVKRKGCRISGEKQLGRGRSESFVFISCLLGTFYQTLSCQSSSIMVASPNKQLPATYANPEN